ncbi:glycosyltransferase family 1 protein [Herbiconiux sp. KACC 21604]|uniref:glycosyltransferase family 4 protein n=1 Tax=unclassified Herbiconiux TaxID=2618217 RepID=UPI0014924150|nr:glycosyltransferase family 1 protein [Herbiconiux sp. SALV-R1]QJU54491.1 glycosyltransferase family 1 protein [Herbiconiux sp. SALV-R1]WPO85569.1 glycosyltransferase family 1 protein [Herbiconiux sp. KACC 21604]
MRVAIISESFLPTVNGVTNSVCKVLDHLADHGHQAIVIAPQAGSPSHYRGFPVHQVPAVAYRQFPVGIPNAQVARIIARFEPDLLHAASPFLLGAQGIAAANRLGVPSVAIFQTDVAGYARRNRLGATAKLAWRVVKWVHDGADLTLAPSQASLADLRSAGVERLGLWGRGVDLQRYHPNNRLRPGASALHDLLAGPARDDVVVGYVGRVAPEKGLERLAALRGVPGIHLAVVGDGPSDEHVRRITRGMPATFLGRLSGEQLADAYASFDVFVHTGTEETFGQTLQEAHASGLPVVAPAAGGPIDLVDHGVNGFLFDPADVSDFRRHVATLAADPALRMRMGEAGRRAVLGRSWQTICDELLGHYRAVMARRGARKRTPVGSHA